MESVVLGVAGATVGIGVAFALRSVFGPLRLLQFMNIGPVHLDVAVLTAAVVGGVLASLLGGALPAFLGSGLDLNAQLKASGPTHAGGAAWIRTGLATLQVAVSLVLVAGAYLFADTLRAYARAPLGFEPAGLSVFAVEESVVGYSPTRSVSYINRLVERVSALPGVQGVALVSLPPFAGGTNRVRVSDGGVGEVVEVASDWVSPGYFGVMEIPLLRGEDFSAADQWADSSRRIGPVIISEAAARQLFGASDPIGQMLSVHGFRSIIHERVIGIVGDIVYSGVQRDPTPMVYEPVASPMQYPMLVVRAQVPTAAITREVSEAARVVDPDLPVDSRGSMSSSIAAAHASQTLFMQVVGFLSTLTLLLTAVGVYSLVAYGVTTRTREFGIRLAVGAAPANLIRVAVGPSVFISTVGTLAGVAGALYLTRFIAAYLYGVSRFDPWAFATAAGILAAAVLLASWLPARRAAKIDPMVALRYE